METFLRVMFVIGVIIVFAYVGWIVISLWFGGPAHIVMGTGLMIGN